MRRLQWIHLMVVLAMALVSGCSVLDADQTLAVKDATGVDPGNDSAVVGAAMSGQVMGNQEEAAPLAVTAEEARQRANEDRGDEILLREAGPGRSADELRRAQFIDQPFANPARLAEARERYLTALDRYGLEDKGDRVAELNRKVGDTFAGEAVSAQARSGSDPEWISLRWRRAAGQYLGAAEAATSPESRASYLARRAHALYSGGVNADACQAARQALALSPSQAVAAMIVTLARC